MSRTQNVDHFLLKVRDKAPLMQPDLPRLNPEVYKAAAVVSPSSLQGPVSPLVAVFLYCEVDISCGPAVSSVASTQEE
jgi:hypothetical protein